MPFDSLPFSMSETVPGRRRLAGLGWACYLGRAMAGVILLCGRTLSGLVNAWLVHRDRKRARHEILALDDRALRDIGLCRCDAIQGVARQLWRP